MKTIYKYFWHTVQNLADFIIIIIIIQLLLTPTGMIIGERKPMSLSFAH